MANKLEQQVIREYQNKGYKVFTSGWPDLLLIHPETKEVLAIEVKSTRDSLKPNQKNIHSILNFAGLKTFVIRPATFYTSELEEETIYERIKDGWSIKIKIEDNPEEFFLKSKTRADLTRQILKLCKEFGSKRY